MGCARLSDSCTELARKGVRIRRWRGHQLRHCTAQATTCDAIAEFLLHGADLGQKRHWIERSILCAQLPLYGSWNLAMPQRAFVRRRWSMVALDDFCALPPL